MPGEAKGIVDMMRSIGRRRDNYQNYLGSADSFLQHIPFVARFLPSYHTAAPHRDFPRLELRLEIGDKPAIGISVGRGEEHAR